MLLGAIARENDLFNMSFMKGAKGWIVSIISIVIGVGVCARFNLGMNLFRGTFDPPIEPLTMVVLLLCAVISTWGIGNFVDYWSKPE